MLESAIQTLSRCRHLGTVFWCLSTAASRQSESVFDGAF